MQSTSTSATVDCSDDTTYEQVKNKVMELEALSTRWDSSNSLSLPTRVGMDEATPMEVDYIRGDKGKKGGKEKTKDQKGKSWRSGDKGKSQPEHVLVPSSLWRNVQLCHNCCALSSFLLHPFLMLCPSFQSLLSQVEEQSPAGVNPGGASSSSGQGGQVKEDRQSLHPT